MRTGLVLETSEHFSELTQLLSPEMILLNLVAVKTSRHIKNILFIKTISTPMHWNRTGIRTGISKTAENVLVHTGKRKHINIFVLQIPHMIIKLLQLGCKDKISNANCNLQKNFWYLPIRTTSNFTYFVHACVCVCVTETAQERKGQYQCGVSNEVSTKHNFTESQNYTKGSQAGSQRLFHHHG
jgi:hypothetical protein